jgi:NodT family efflux transporter outer membrane factor (OMF) lipoprotein
MSFMRALAVTVSPILLFLLGGCVMGPDFGGPPTPPTTMGAAFARAEPVKPAPSSRQTAWWRDLNDPLLDALIGRALASNPSNDVAQARVRQARSQFRGAQAARAPVVGSGAGAGDLRAPSMLTGRPAQSSSVFVAGFDALWEVDAFGGRRRGEEAAQAGLDAALAEADGARLSLTAETARTYLAYRGVQLQLELARQALTLQERANALSRQLETAGRISRVDHQASERGLEGRRLAVNALEAELTDLRDALAVLTGEAPGALDVVLAEARPIPLPPASVTIDDPATMLARRPDIRAAEHRLHLAYARIGMAQAARMPSVTLAGVVGLGGAAEGDLDSSNNLFSLAGPSLQWNFVDFGRGRAGVDQAVAGRDEAEAAYQAAVLSALQDAEAALNRYGEARRALGMHTRALASARSSAELTRQAYTAGRSSALDAIAADGQRLEAELAVAQASAELTICYAALQKALAMGWEG